MEKKQPRNKQISPLIITKNRWEIRDRKDNVLQRFRLKMSAINWKAKNKDNYFGELKLVPINL